MATSGPLCARCGGPTRLDQFGNGICNMGRARQTCGFWWRRDGRCAWNWSRVSPDEVAACPGGCEWDHTVHFVATHTTADGREHFWHSPESWCQGHTLLCVVRPRGKGRRWYKVPLSSERPEHTPVRSFGRVA